MNFRFAPDRALAPKLDRAGLWLVLVGAGLIGLGLIACADLSLTRVAATYGVGAAMVIAAAFQLAHSVAVREWRETIFWLTSALLYFAAGAITIAQPEFAASLLTLLLAAMLAASGIARLALGWTRYRPGMGWLVASGLTSLAAGVAIALTWPLDAVWLLGFVLAVDLFFQGFAMVLFGLSVRQLR